MSSRRTIYDLPFELLKLKWAIPFLVGLVLGFLIGFIFPNTKLYANYFNKIYPHPISDPNTANPQEGSPPLTDEQVGGYLKIRLQRQVIANLWG